MTKLKTMHLKILWFWAMVMNNQKVLFLACFPSVCIYAWNGCTPVEWISIKFYSGGL